MLLVAHDASRWQPLPPFAPTFETFCSVLGLQKLQELFDFSLTPCCDLLQTRFVSLSIALRELSETTPTGL